MSHFLKAGYGVLAMVALTIALLVGVVFGVALIGGGSLARSASQLAGTLGSIAIYTASLSMFLALLYMYVAHDHHLRIDENSDE